jgi:hypothetical protein
VYGRPLVKLTHLSLQTQYLQYLSTTLTAVRWHISCVFKVLSTDRNKGDLQEMKRILLLAAIVAAVIFGISCNREQAPQSTLVNSNGSMLPPDDQYWAKNNFDLQRVGDIVKRSRSPEEFERYLNRPGGINNLDLNGDGYADYISVREYNDLNDPYSRGLSMYTQYGPDQIQEIGDVLFYRDQPQYPGARILLRGDPRMYGDNFYYQNNWLDQSLQLVSYLFNGNRDVYSTPYYYDNYPTWYQTYDVVETPVYQRRVVELYPQPIVVYTTQPEFIDKIDIRSPNDGRYYSEAQAVFVKPAREQEDFIRKNPRPDHMVKTANDRGPGAGRPENGKPENGKPDRAESQQPRPEQQPNAQPEPRQPRQEAPRGQRPNIARNEKPGRGRGNNPGNSGKASNPAPARPAPARPAPAGKPAKSPGGGNHGNGGNKGGGKPGGGGGNKGGGGKKH